MSRNRVYEGKDIMSLYNQLTLTSLNSSTAVEDTPIIVAQSGDTRPGMMGLGSAPTILNKLYEAGLIAARTYSLYIGTGFSRAGGDRTGSNVFGGYDSARFMKPVYTYYMKRNTSDYLSVNVSDIIIDEFSDRTKQRLSLMDGEKFKATITTDQYPMRFPYQIIQRFVAALDAIPANNEDNSLRLKQPFNGSVTILLSDGFNVTFPPSALFNMSGLSPFENTPSNYTGPYYLSTSWLTQVYLTLDFDAEQFHLAPAVPHAQQILTKTLCPGSFPAPHEYDGPDISYFHRNGLIGAIAGGVVGGAAILVLLLLFLMLWRRSQTVEAHEEKLEAGPKSRNIQGETTAPMSGAGSVADNIELQRLSRHSEVVTPTPAPPPITRVESYGLVQEAVEIVRHESEDGGSESPVSDLSNLSSGRTSWASVISRPASIRSNRR